MTRAKEARLYVLWRDSSVGGQSRGRLSLYTSDDGARRGPLTQGGCLWTPSFGRRGDGLHRQRDLYCLCGEALGALLISANGNDTVSLDLVSTVVQYASGDGGYNFDLVEGLRPYVVNS